MIIELTKKRWPRILSGSVYAMQVKARLEGRLSEHKAEFYKRSIASIKGAATKRRKRAVQADADIATLIGNVRGGKS